MLKNSEMTVMNMKLAMAQMQMEDSIDRNLAKTIRCMEQAAEAGADLIFFPEVQLTPFFPQYEKRDADPWAMALDGKEVTAMRDACRRLGLYASPNIYLKQGAYRFDASLMLGPGGSLLHKADHRERLVVLDVPLEMAARERVSRPWLTL